ncbi:MAG: toll/interleukin-1 receptor domain-containing protein, partial [Oscillibacter sp.]|nr:toll/interleukin-1 receptor domain-containing protein [Oscillibacter sp.]
MELFLSYVNEDKEEAIWIADTLAKYGYQVHIQSWDSPGGNEVTSWPDNIRNSASYFIPLCSKFYFESSKRRGEFYSALLFPDDEHIPLLIITLDSDVISILDSFPDVLLRESPPLFALNDTIDETPLLDAIHNAIKSKLELAEDTLPCTEAKVGAVYANTEIATPSPLTRGYREGFPAPRPSPLPSPPPSPTRAQADNAAQRRSMRERKLKRERDEAKKRGEIEQRFPEKTSNYRDIIGAPSISIFSRILHTIVLCILAILSFPFILLYFFAKGIVALFLRAFSETIRFPSRIKSFFMKTRKRHGILSEDTWKSFSDSEDFYV